MGAWDLGRQAGGEEHPGMHPLEWRQEIFPFLFFSLCTTAI